MRPNEFINIEAFLIRQSIFTRYRLFDNEHL